MHKFKRKKTCYSMKQTNMLSKRFKSIMVVDKKGKTKEIFKKNKRRNKPDDGNTMSIEITNVEDSSFFSEHEYSNNKEEKNHFIHCKDKNVDHADGHEVLHSTQSVYKSDKSLSKRNIHSDGRNKIKKNDSFQSKIDENEEDTNRSEKNITVNVNEESSKKENDSIFSIGIGLNGDSSSSDYKSMDEENSGDYVSLDDGNESNMLHTANKEKIKKIQSEFVVFENESKHDDNKKKYLKRMSNENTTFLDNLSLNDYSVPPNEELDGSKKLIVAENKLKERNKGEKTIKRKFRKKDKMSEKKDISSSNNKNPTKKKGLKDKIMDKASNVKETLQKKANKMTGGSKNESKDSENSSQTQGTMESKISEKAGKQSANASETSSKQSNKSCSSSTSSRSGSSLTNSSRNSRSSSNSSAKQESMSSNSQSVSSVSNSKMRGCCCTNKGAKGDMKSMSSSSSSSVKKNLNLVNGKNKNGNVASSKNESSITDKDNSDTSRLSAQEKGKDMVSSQEGSVDNTSLSTQSKEEEMRSGKKSVSHNSNVLVGGDNSEDLKEGPKKDYPSYVKKYTNDPLEDDKIMVPEKASDKKTSPKSSSAGKSVAVGAAGVAGAGIILGKGKDSGSPKSVLIDEDKNEEFEVKKDNNKSTPLSNEEKADGKSGAIQATPEEEFIPMKISSTDLGEESEILKDRRENNIVCEGHMWKRRRIFACFWHEKYFILDKDGVLRYHKANGTKAAKGLWNIKEVHKIHEIFVGTENHPYRLAMICSSENLIFAFDDPDTREYWYKNFNSFING